VAASEKAKGFVVEAKKIEAKAKKFKDKVAAEEKSLANVCPVASRECAAWHSQTLLLDFPLPPDHCR